MDSIGTIREWSVIKLLIIIFKPLANCLPKTLIGRFEINEKLPER